VTARVRVELRRTGGFAGRTVHVRLDSADMPPADAAQLVRLVSTLDLGRLKAGRSTAGADLMRYELTIERGGQHWHGTVAEPAVPAELRPLLQFLTR
jgi:hypothetical protein